MNKTVFLMYHELEVPGRPLCRTEQGYVRYVIADSDFRQQIAWLRERHFQGMSVEYALSHAGAEGVVITFDDGSETDLLTAAPALIEAAFGATFYITVGFLGQRGYLNHQQVRELSAAGFDIGCHSMTHPYLSDLSPSALDKEIRLAKLELEQIVGKPVLHFSCPGGRWSRQAAEVAKASGYASVSSSRIGANAGATDAFNLARIAVTRGMPIAQFQDICEARGIWRLQLRGLTRDAAKQILGNTVYDRLRTRALER